MDNRSIYKASHFNNKVLLINGWEGSGKTCISNVFKSLKNSEVMRYSYELEWICYLWMADKLGSNDASLVLRSISDLLIYNHMQSREVNFRIGDLSSIFRSPIWYKYICRLFSKGGYETEALINDDLVLHLVTHKIYECRHLLQEAFGSRLIHIEVIRDPIFMLKQTKFNQDTLHLTKSPRDFSFRYIKNNLPVYDGYENSDPITTDSWELSVRFLQRRMNYYMETDFINNDPKELPYMLFFEEFVKNPKEDIRNIEFRYNLKFGDLLSKYLKIEKIPRKHHSDAKARSIYKKIGWVKLNNKKNSLSERDSYISHYRDIGVPGQALEHLVQLSDRYRKWKNDFYKNNRNYNA